PPLGVADRVECAASGDEYRGGGLPPPGLPSLVVARGGLPVAQAHAATARGQDRGDGGEQPSDQSVSGHPRVPVLEGRARAARSDDERRVRYEQIDTLRQRVEQ